MSSDRDAGCLYNEGLHDLYGSPNIVRPGKLGRLWLAGRMFMWETQQMYTKFW